MNQFKVGDLVWIPASTYGFDQPKAAYPIHTTTGPTYGLVLEVNDRLAPPKVKVSLGKVEEVHTFWFRENQIYKENGDAYGKVC